MATPDNSRMSRFTPQHWAPLGAVIVCLVLYVILPKEFTVGPDWIFVVIEVAILGVLIVESMTNRMSIVTARRAGIAGAGLLSLANAGSLVLLSHALLFQRHLGPGTLTKSAADIWITNLVVFALWYWLLDRGGQAVRGTSDESYPDFFFPQMEHPHLAPEGWTPQFVDYAYLSFTNLAAFSPTDTLPLSPIAKLLMTFQSMISLVTIGLVVARIVNLIG